MPTLFQIGAEISALHDLLTETGGELPNAEAEAAIDEWLAETEQALETKVNSYVWLIKEFQGRSEARELAAKHLMASAGADLNQAERLKARLKAFLEICGLTKLQTEHFKLTIAANGGVLPLVFPEEWERDPENAPERYHKITVALNKTLLRKDAEALAAGEMTPMEYEHDTELNGAAEIVRLGERGNHLRIR